ncbi:unnamed protein product [Soboliphyme baturini]|uniref:Decaprenyl-diphosphate synthase subunit 1 n=1 Tax=Soboliphyme baturini TaxID=241478 RepID=A0A183J2R4_9BILA|nr:unnamed protein product [Soboliphyme baturini]
MRLRSPLICPRALKTTADEGSINRWTSYAVSGSGKMLRPTIILLMADLCNWQTGLLDDKTVQTSQYKIAMIAEMIHTSSLIHDDIIDESDQRRGRATVSKLKGARLVSVGGDLMAVFLGDYILAKATELLTTLNNADVIQVLSQVIEDLVKGELMQSTSVEDGDKAFVQYLNKTYRKTASLFSHSLKATAICSGASETIQDAAFLFGKNFGMAFQLMDDVLDFVSTEENLGKPAGVDLRLGICTGPVLFACDQYPELQQVVRSRYCSEEDVPSVIDMVKKSDGILRTKQLAEQYCNQAIRQLDVFPVTESKRCLIDLVTKQTTRNK